MQQEILRISTYLEKAVGQNFEQLNDDEEENNISNPKENSGILILLALKDSQL